VTVKLDEELKDIAMVHFLFQLSNGRLFGRLL
jgi:hypothetical protein